MIELGFRVVIRLLRQINTRDFASNVDSGTFRTRSVSRILVITLTIFKLFSTNHLIEENLSDSLNTISIYYDANQLIYPEL